MARQALRAKRHSFGFLLPSAALAGLGWWWMQGGNETASALVFLAAAVLTVFGLRALLDLQPHPNLTAGWLCLPVRPEVARELVGEMLEDPDVRELVTSWSEQMGKFRMVEVNQLIDARPAWIAHNVANAG